jgi:hypothetical protein
VIGLAEKLAAKDPDRFVWIKEKGFLKYARKRKSGMYSVRAVRYSVDVAKQIGVLVPTQKTKNGVFRTGFVVADHKVVSTTHGNRCILNLDVRSDSGFGSTQSAAQNTPSAATSAYEKPPSAAASASENDTECLSDCPSDCLSVMGQDIEGETLRKAAPVNDTRNFPQKYSSEPSQPSQVNPYSPVKQSPARQNKTASTKSQNDNNVFLTDYDREPHLYAKTNDKTIGEHFNFSDWRLEAVINAISDGEFDTKYLTGYKDVPNLLACCDQSIQELAHDPFLGRLSCARVMGKAMEILRRDYGKDVPKGWVPVMKGLRTNVNMAISVSKEECDDKPVPSGASYYQKEPWEDAYEAAKRRDWIEQACDPYNTFGDFPTVLRWARGTIDSDLAQLAQVKAIFLWVSARYGFYPESAQRGLPYLEDVIHNLTLQGIPIPDVVSDLQRHLIEKSTGNEVVSCRSAIGLDLRTQSRPGVTLLDPHSGKAYFLDRDVYEYRKKRRNNPENIFGAYSAVYAADCEAADELSKQTTVRRLFEELAQEQGGVPTCYQDGLKFMQLVAERCTLQGITVPDAALRIQKRLEEINERLPEEVKGLSDRKCPT